MKRALYLALFLALTAGLAGGMLSFVDNMTKDKIAAAAIEKEKIYLDVIFPNSEFVQKTEEVSEVDGILDLFEVTGKGTVYKVVNKGYGGEIVFLVGFNNDQEIEGIAVVTHGETPGIGDVIESDAFQSNLVGKKGSDKLDVSSGATFSSNAINNGIIAAAQHLNGGEALDIEVELGVKKFINDEKVAKYKTEIVSKEVDGDNTVYEVKAEGYGLKDAEFPSADYKENEFKIVKNTATNEIVSIEMTVFGDTEGIGDSVKNPNYFKTFVGISSIETEVDTVSTATLSSNSVIAAVRAVLEDQ